MSTHFTYDFEDYSIIQIPVLDDNYIYLMTHGQQAVVIDPAVAKPVNAILEEQGLELVAILNTHHHFDHVGGNQQLIDRWGCEVFASDYDRNRIPGITTRLNDRDEVSILGLKARIIFIPGHTLGHIAYHFFEKNWLFSGDTIFSLGCGRLFEGNPQQMHNSLSKLKALPDETMIFCTHEYTEANLKFHLSVLPLDKAIQERQDEIFQLRGEDKPTVPMTLGLEKNTNLFLRSNDPLLRQALKLANEPEWQVFAKLRELKDNF